MSGDVTFTQSLEKVVPVFEFGHLDIGVTYFMGSMGVAAGDCRDAVFPGEGSRLCCRAEQRTSGVKNFDNVNLTGQFF